MEARAIQRTVRQSARKMRLVIDQIRGQAVPQAYAILRFSKKLAAKQIHKVLKSAVMGRATPIKKRTSHVEIHVEGEAESRAPKASAKTGAKTEAIARPVRAGSAGAAKGKRAKAKKAGGKSKTKKEDR